MKPIRISREEMWAKQRIAATDIDYAVWEQDKSMRILNARQQYVRVNSRHQVLEQI